MLMNSWIHVDSNSDFSIYNIPFGVYSMNAGKPRCASAIGKFIIDLHELQVLGYFDNLDLPADIFKQSYLNNFIALGNAKTNHVRSRLIELLDDANPILKNRSDIHYRIFIPREKVQLLMPVKVPNYTDFYSSKYHAENVGKMFRDPDNALLPNWKYIPVGYHGRASSIVVGGVDFHRPKGQIKPADGPPIFGPSRKLDIEIEMAFVVNSNSNLGDSISIENAKDNIFGLMIFNDWSARDIQKWEYVPLGPFLGKNFASSVSPWIVTLAALEPFKVPLPEQEPATLSYLEEKNRHSYDIHLKAFIENDNFKAHKITSTNYKYMYWTMAQQLAHHTVNGCNIEVGDLYASGTISGPEPGSYGSLLEITWGGKNEIKLPDGSKRTFLEDGDRVIIKGYAEKEGIRVGFGEVRAMVLPSII